MTNLVAVLGSHSGLGVNGHVEVPKDYDVNISENVDVGSPVEEPDLLCAGEGAQEADLLAGHITGLVLTPPKLPRLLPALGNGVTIGHTLQVGIYPEYREVRL